MADIRIKDLATTATTTASDDFMAVDGAINGTRKLSAATPAFLTSVTTPSLTSPAANDLTLAGGSSGASLVLGQGASGFGTLTTTAANQQLQLKGGASFHEGLIFSESATPLSDTNAAMLYAGPSSYLSGTAYGAGVALTPGVPFFRISRHNNLNNGATAELLRVVQSTGNLLIGGTTDITGSGGLKVFGTTAASSSASGSLINAGGFGNTGSAYFGDGTADVRVRVLSSNPYALAVNRGGIGSNGYFYLGATAAASPSLVFSNNAGTEVASITSAGAATFAGAVTTGDAITVSKSTNSDLANYIYNANAGAAAQTSLYISNGTAAAESTFITANGTGLTTVGGFIQDGGAIGSGTSLSGGLSIMARAASSDIRFYAGSHTNLVATFASTGAATFAGAVAIGNTVAVGAAVASTHKVTMVIGGVTYYLLASNV